MQARVADAVAQKGAADRMLAAVHAAGTFNLFATIAAVAAGAILASNLVRTIVRPLSAMTGVMHQLAGGALETPIPCVKRRDEVGAMAQAMLVFREGLLAVASLNAEKDAERIARRSRVHAMEGLNRTFEAEVGGVTAALAEAAARMTSSARTMRETSAQTMRRCALD